MIQPCSNLCKRQGRARLTLLAVVLLACLPAVLASCLLVGTPAAKPQEQTPRKPWVLLPLNVEDVPPEYLSDGAEILDAILGAELERREIPFIQLTLVEGLERWIQASDAVGGILVDQEAQQQQRVEDARKHLIESLLREYQAVGVIWPDLHERKAVKKKRKLTWDGVTKQIPGSVLAKYVDTPNLGSSLRARVFDDQAALVSDDYLGLEIIHRFQVLEGHRVSFRWTALVRTDLFENPRMLAKAASALLPDGPP